MMKIPQQKLLLILFYCMCLCNSSFDEVVSSLDATEPLFVTYTTGATDRIALTSNLLKSLQMHSPKLAANALIACLDNDACKWCQGLVTAKGQGRSDVSAKICHCIEDTVNATASDAYASAYWSAAVVRKVGVIRDFVQSPLKFAIFADHDVVVKASLDDIFSQPAYITTPIATMCDFPKTFRPENKMANTGFIMIKNSDDSKKMINKWFLDVNSNSNVDNDQPPFQEIAKKSEFLKTHRCSDEKEGLAMWFHKKKISGSGLNKQWYFDNLDKIKVFHANDITSCAKKVQVLKQLNMWYLDGNSNSNSNNKGNTDISIDDKDNIKSPEKIRKQFPVHWGNPPSMQTKDMREWPQGYGRGSGTVGRWIQENIDRDATTLSSSSLSSKETDRSPLDENEIINQYLQKFNRGKLTATSSEGYLLTRLSKANKFYIYDWDEKLFNITSQDPSHKSRSVNYGAGPLLDAKAGQFNTYMHSLFPILIRRLLAHPLRTLHPTEAAWFFIPYDITSDAYYNKNGHLHTVIDLLLGSAHFMEHVGQNHFFIDSSEPFWYDKKIITSVLYRLCKKCLKFTPSTLPVPYQKWQHDFVIDRTYIHIPYTSTWHYYEGSSDRLVTQNSPGTLMAESSSSAWSWDFDVNMRRENLMTFVGIIKKMTRSATELRRTLVKQCKAGNEKHGLEKLENYDAFCALRVLDKNAWKDFGNEADIYKRTTFCLLPTGDIPSRKAVFDMILAGCIPVVFDHRQIDIYKWHLTEEEIKDIHILIDIKDVISKDKQIVDVPQLIANIEWSRVIEMRQAIKRVAWKLQYSLPNFDADAHRKNENIIDRWKPTHGDALEVIVENLMNQTFMQDILTSSS